jgi:GT2 family glycosyltransferase
LTVKVAFVSSKDHLIESFLHRVAALYPELPLWVVAEFPPPQGKWIPYKPNRTFKENRERIRAALAGHSIRLSAVVLEPNTPYRGMRWIAFLLSPSGFLAFNENLDHFMLRPRSLPAILGHFAWRVKNFVRWQLRPGGWVYTWAWRLRHPSQLRRPIYYRLALLFGKLAVLSRRILPGKADPPASERPQGTSVVVPSRGGRDLLARLLPGLIAQLPGAGEVIVVDNGSEDGTAAWLAETFPNVRVETSEAPLSFAAAVNRGIRAARYSHVCLINNDMILDPGFFAPLTGAFEENPDLFCATAQILFPEGMRRQETGKAVWWTREAGRGPKDFPVRCLTPLEGEDGTWVLYGSGGCSLYSAQKLEQLGGFDKILAPAYVEDLDICWRAWQRNWPTVYAGEARVTHFHRSTTARYFKPELLASFVEFNFLRFLTRRVADPHVFGGLWRDAIVRLNLLAVEQPWFVSWALEALRFAWKATRLWRPPPEPLYPETFILAIGDGSHAVFKGALNRGRPRILVVSPYVPYPLSHGGAVRIYNLMREAARDYDLILAAFAEDLTPAPGALVELCAAIVIVERHKTHLLADRGRPDTVEEFASLTMSAVLGQVMRKWRPDIAQLEFTQMAQYARDCAPAKTILVEHDITYDLQRQLLEQGEDWETRRQYNRWLEFEQQAWMEVNAVAVMSEQDRLTVAALAGENRPWSLPNGVDLERFHPSGHEPEPRRILFIGSFAHLPNVLAIDFFLRECWPLLRENGTKLHIIAGARHRYFLERCQASASVDLDQPAIEVEDFVSDVRPAYERAAVVIAPLVASAGTNIKIMEAMAMGKAIVSTPAGINGLDLTDGRDVVVARTGEEMAVAVRSLLDDPARRRELERQARMRVERDYDWKQIGLKQRELYERLRVRR